MHRYLVLTPTNSAGIQDLERGVDCSKNVIEHEIPSKEIGGLFKQNVIDKINIKCKTLIDEYESEDIPLGQCANALEILRKDGFGEGVFALALKEALNYGTFVECDF